MKFIAIFLLITGCATTPVTQYHWDDCMTACEPEMVSEACVHFWKGNLCECGDGLVVRLDTVQSMYLEGAY